MNNYSFICLCCHVTSNDGFVCTDCWESIDSKILNNLVYEYFEKSKELMNILEIPYVGCTVDITVLYQILNDPIKCKKIISKLNCQSFW